MIISHPSAVGNWHAILLSLTLFGQQQPKTASKNINKQKLVYYTCCKALAIYLEGTNPTQKKTLHAIQFWRIAVVGL
jgi:hypothetical protein